MVLITGIVPDPKRPGRYEVFVDGRSFATVSAEAIERLRLRVGAALSEDLSASVERDAQALRTYDRALNMLAFRPRSVTELRRQLLRKGESAEHVDAAVARLQTAGLLDDAQYARQYAHSKVVGSGYSKRRLQAELFKRGV